MSEAIVDPRSDMGGFFVGFTRSGQSASGVYCTEEEARDLASALAAHLGMRLVPADAEVAPEGYVATRYDRPGWQVAKDESGLQLGWWAYTVVEDEDGNPKRQWLGSINLHDGFATAKDAADAIAKLERAALQEEAEP